MKRRSLLLGALGASLVTPAVRAEASAAWACPAGTLPAGARVLFQGDSITDGGRSRDGKEVWRLMGQGYPYLIASDCGGRAPGSQQFFNRGIAGNRIDDLVGRWQADTLELKPDVLSILIGINDVTSVVNGRAAEATLANFKPRYAELLEQTRKALPKLRLILGEPFASDRVGTERWPRYQELLPAYQAVVADLAARFDAPLIRYQRLFDEAASRAAPAYWLMDGIHPTNAGHRLMADEWLRVFAAAS